MLAALSLSFFIPRTPRLQDPPNRRPRRAASSSSRNNARARATLVHRPDRARYSRSTSGRRGRAESPGETSLIIAPSVSSVVSSFLALRESPRGMLRGAPREAPHGEEFPRAPPPTPGACTHATETPRSSWTPRDPAAAAWDEGRRYVGGASPLSRLPPTHTIALLSLPLSRSPASRL